MENTEGLKIYRTDKSSQCSEWTRDGLDNRYLLLCILNILGSSLNRCLTEPMIIGVRTCTYFVGNKTLKFISFCRCIARTSRKNGRLGYNGLSVPRVSRDGLITLIFRSSSLISRQFSYLRFDVHLRW